jgi:chromosome segregation ATPase
VSVSSKQNAYIDRRLAVLAERVEDRLRGLRAEETELLRRREEASERLRALRSSIERTGEVVLEDRDAVETKADRSQYRSLEAVVAQLRSQRDRAWDAIDEAEARLDEIEAARRTLEKRGINGILAIVEERRAGVSPALRNYLAKLLEM